MSTTERNPGGGVVGFAIAFLAFAFGGVLGLPESARLLVIGAGVLLAVFSAGMRGLGLAALALGGVTLISTIVLLGAIGAPRDLRATPSNPTVDDATGPQGGRRVHPDARRQAVD